MRYKGNFSLMMGTPDGKLSFRLNFDRFEDAHPEIANQRFYGFKELTFSSNFDDASRMREALANELFRDRGVAAPRVAFYRIVVNTGARDESWGLYTLVEDRADPAMLASQFGGASGNLYKPDVGAVRFAPGRVLHAFKSVTTVTPPALESHSGAHKSDQFLTGTPPIRTRPNNVHARTRASCASIASSSAAPNRTLVLAVASCY